MDLWEKLHLITQFERSAICRGLPPTFSPRKGAGTIQIQEQTEDMLTFFEKGTWQTSAKAPFTHVYRFKKSKKALTLEQFFIGTEQPVPLMTLSAIEPHLYKTLAPHECEEDAHFGSVLFDRHFIHLTWKKMGPRTNELHTIVYS